MRRNQSNVKSVGVISVSGVLAAICCVATTVYAVDDGSWRTALFGLFVVFGGVGLIRRQAARLQDNQFRKVEVLWAAKIVLTLLMLTFGWMPQLDPNTSPAWGYDPQRYYVQAQELVQNKWSLEFLSLNYGGILYFYGAVYVLFGINPVAPALVNCLVSLVAFLILTGPLYQCTRRVSDRHWLLGLTIVLPEVIWFDVMTSRESVMAALITISIVYISAYIVALEKRTLLVVAIIALSAAAIAAIRATMLIALASSVTLMLFLITPGKGTIGRRPLLAGLIVGMLICGPIITLIFGGYEIRFKDVFQIVASGNENFASNDTVEWSKNSIGKLLIPNNLYQAILYTPARAVLYIVTPLPNFTVNITAMLSGSWEAWQQSITVISAVVYIIIFPYALASFVEAWKYRRRNPLQLAIHLGCWIVLAAISGGNVIIHERYRLMGATLLCGCAWLGYVSCDPRRVRGFVAAWSGMLFIGGIFYMVYKYASL